jgi:hypothetical protein
MTLRVPKPVLIGLAVLLLVGVGVGVGITLSGGDGDGSDESGALATSPETTEQTTTTEPRDPPDPDGRYRIDCDYLLGDRINDYSFVASGTLRNTGNIGIVTQVTIEWEQIGTDPVTHEETVQIPEGKTEEIQVEIPVTSDQIDRIQAGSGRYCNSNVKIVDTFRGAPTASTAGQPDFEQYASETGGWSAEIPTGGGWGSSVETEPTPGQLFRTEITGPNGTVLIVDSTPFEAPTFNAESQSRTVVDHPTFGSAEKIVFQGSDNIESCVTGTCVDYLLASPDGGGFGVLAGGPGDFDALQDIAERVALSLKPYGD